MERLTIDEIIEHCGRKTRLYEQSCGVKYLETEVMGNGIKEYWEHKQVAEYLKKFKEYEDLDEQGLLLRLPCNKVWFICDKGTEYATIMSKDIDDLTGYEVRKIDRDGRYWSTKEKAKAKLAEMEGAG